MNSTDIAIIGSGASGTHCLLQVLAQLDGSADPVHITVIDRDPQFHCGIPYGHRSGPSSLLITKLSDFLSQTELDHFTDWLDEKRDAILATSKLDREWLDRHGEDIKHGRWNDLYLPRRLYGRYLRTRVESEIRRAQKKNSATVDYLTAEITEVVPQSDSTTIIRGTSCQKPSSLVELHAHTTVLAVGSPPVKKLTIVHDPTGEPAEVSGHDLPGYVSDIHAPTIEDVIAAVGDRLGDLPESQRRILVVGGNADALEFVLASAQMRERTGAVLSVLSTQGRPYYWRHEHPDEQPELGAVQDLLGSIAAGASPTAREFFLAVDDTVTESIARGSDKATVAAIMESVGRVIDHMDEAELAEMAGAYGLRISDLLRQAGGDAIDLLDAASGEAPVTFERGRFDSAEFADGLYTVTVRRPATKVTQTAAGQATATMETEPSRGSTSVLGHRYAAVINATGFEAVADTRSPLLRNLLSSGAARTSCSGAGLATDADFRSAPGLYVLGPLLSGFNHDGTVVWHAESVNRIIHLAAWLAPRLVADTLQRRIVAASPRASVSWAG